MAWTHQLDSQIGLYLPDMAVGDRSLDDPLDCVCIVTYCINSYIPEIVSGARGRLSDPAQRTRANAPAAPAARALITRRRTTGARRLPSPSRAGAQVLRHAFGRRHGLETGQGGIHIIP